MTRYETNQRRMYDTTSYLDRQNMIDTLKTITLIPDVDLDISKKNFEVSIFWHRPSLNVSWYPILQIDTMGITVFHREGPENRKYWHLVLDDAINFIEMGREDYDNEENGI